MTDVQSPSPKLVLGPNIVIAPANDIPGADPGDIVIDRSDLRQHARLANASVAALLDRFREPNRLPDVIAVMARDLQVDPYELLTEAAPLVDELVTANILQDPDKTPTIDPVFAVGAKVGNYTIHKIVRQTSDTEVALAISENGDPVALKTVCPNADEYVADGFLREVDIARQLSGTLAPKVITLIDSEPSPVMVTEWSDALPLDRYAALCCASRQDRLRLCQSVLRAFAALHAQGILHGDIRPSNILVDGQERVTLLDFGLSQWSDQAPLRHSFELAYMEPEAAEVLLQGTLPALTEKGEVCALGLLLAEAVFDCTPRRLSQLRDRALTQIATEDCVIRTGWAELDALLTGAVARKEQRLTSITVMYERFDTLVARRLTLPRFPTLDTSDNAATENAMLALRFSEVSSDPDQLARADRFLRQACDTGFKSIDKADPWHSPVATLLLQARAAYAMRNFGNARRCIEAVIGMDEQPDRLPELFLGTAGDLTHLARFYGDFQNVDERVGDLSDLIDRRIERQTQSLSAALAGLKRSQPTHLGMAHGLAGQVYALLVTANAREEKISEKVCEGMDALASLAQPFGGGSAWPGTLHARNGDAITADFAPGWCNGTAGFLLLWMEAAKASPNDRFATLAEASAQFTLAHPDETPNLCCGLSGRAIGLASYADWTKSEVWQRKAAELADRAADIQDGDPLGSLSRGRMGSVLAQLETRVATHSRFPI